MKNTIKSTAIIITTILIPLSVALSIYSHSYTIGASVSGSEEAKQALHHPIKEICFTINSL